MIRCGSTYLKTALIKDKRILSTKFLPTGINCEETAAKLLEIIYKEADITREDVGVITATGYSRRSIGFADATISEITAHACGVP